MIKINPKTKFKLMEISQKKLLKKIYIIYLISTLIQKETNLKNVLMNKDLMILYRINV